MRKCLARNFCLLLFSFFILYLGHDIFYRGEYPKKYTEYVQKYCEQYGVEESLVYAVIRSESNFNPNVTSSVGAKGLMQLTDETYFWVIDRMGCNEVKNTENLYEPENNIKHGVYLLNLLQTDFSEEVNVLSAYHAGRGSVQKWLKNEEYSPDGKVITNIPFGDTKLYVDKVGRTKDIYDTLYERGK